METLHDSEKEAITREHKVGGSYRCHGSESTQGSLLKVASGPRSKIRLSIFELIIDWVAHFGPLGCRGCSIRQVHQPRIAQAVR